MEHWKTGEWYVAGKTDEDMLKSFRDLGGIRPPIHTKIDFIEKYKQKKLDVAQ